MRKGTRLIIALIILLSAMNSRSQSTATAAATVTIVEPVTVSSNQSTAFETVKAPSVFDLLFKNENIYLPKLFAKIPSYNSTITVADLMINAGGLYTVTIPERIFLMNAPGTERMAADLLPGSALKEEAVSNGKNHIIINAGLQVNKGQRPGSYVSQAFDVTVNFN